MSDQAEDPQTIIAELAARCDEAEHLIEALRARTHQLNREVRVRDAAVAQLQAQAQQPQEGTA